MGLSAMLFFLYFLAVLAGLTGLGIWLMRYLTRLNFGREQRILFVVIALACLAFVATLTGIRLYNNNQQPAPPTTSALSGPQLPQQTIQGPQPKAANAQNPLQTQTTSGPLAPPRQLSDEEQLQLFEMEHYPALYEQRVALLTEIRQQEAFFKNINALAVRVPKHRQLLIDIYAIRQKAYQRLKQQNDNVGKQLRDFWVHYNTSNSHDAMTKFDKVSVWLTKQIQESRASLLEDERQEEKVIASHMQKAGAALKVSKIPAHLAGKITAYSPNNREMLLQWLGLNGPQRTLQLLEQLREQRSIIRGRINKVDYFRKRYTDLQTRLTRTLQLWQKAQESNFYADYRLLYAVEARFIVDTLQLSSGESPAKRLHDELNAYTELVGGQAEDALEKAEQAYQPASLR